MPDKQGFHPVGSLLIRMLVRYDLGTQTLPAISQSTWSLSPSKFSGELCLKQRRHAAAIVALILRSWQIVDLVLLNLLGDLMGLNNLKSFTASI